MLGEFAPLKSKHDCGVAEAKQQNLLNVIANEVKQSLKATHNVIVNEMKQSFQLHNNGLPRRCAPRNDDNTAQSHSMLLVCIRHFFDVILDFWRKPIRRGSRTKMQIFKAELKSWMLGEFAPLKSKHDGGVTSVRIKLSKTVQYGRSMIEMLGVLAIIAVLSVAGISGFGKMMKAYHWNTALGQWDVLINTMVKYEAQLHINKNNPHEEGEALQTLIPILKATGDLPDNMQITNSDLYLVDALGNKLRIYSHTSGYIGIGYFVEKNDSEACKMILTMGQYHHNLIQYIQFYNIDKEDDKDKKQNKVFVGDYPTVHTCTELRPCLRDLTVSQINELCKDNPVCKDTKSCRYLVYWY